MTNTKVLSVITAIFGFTFASGYCVAAAAERIQKEEEVSVSFQKSDPKYDTVSSKSRDDARLKPVPEVYYHTEDANRDNAPDAPESKTLAEKPAI